MSSKKEIKETLSAATIETRRAEMASRLERAQEARRGLALSVLEGDTAARHKDAELGEKIWQFSEALATLDAAALQARAREDAVRHEVAASAARAKAADVRARLQFFRQHGADLDLAARTLVESFGRFESAVLDLARQGAGPSPELVRNACRRALEAVLMPTSLKVSHLAPRERHSFAELVDGWSRVVEAWCERTERENAPADKAA